MLQSTNKWFRSDTKTFSFNKLSLQTLEYVIVQGNTTTQKKKVSHRITIEISAVQADRSKARFFNTFFALRNAQQS